MSRCNREQGCRLSFEHVGRCDPSPLRRDLRTVELPEDAKVGEVFLVMLADDGTPVIVRSTEIDSNVMNAAIASTPVLLADLLASADRNISMLVAGGAAFDAGEVEIDENGVPIDRKGEAVLVADVKKMLHAFVRNLAQGLAGRVLK